VFENAILETKNDILQLTKYSSHECSKRLLLTAVISPTYRQHFARSENGLRVIIIISPELTRQEYILVPIFLTDHANQL